LVNLPKVELIAVRARENLVIAGENYGENHPQEPLVNLPNPLTNTLW